MWSSARRPESPRGRWRCWCCWRCGCWARWLCGGVPPSSRAIRRRARRRADPAIPLSRHGCLREDVQYVAHAALAQVGSALPAGAATALGDLAEGADDEGELTAGPQLGLHSAEQLLEYRLHGAAAAAGRV